MDFDQDTLSGPAGSPGGGALVALAKLLARQAAAEEWRRTGCVNEHNADPEAGVADQHEQKRNVSSNE